MVVLPPRSRPAFALACSYAESHSNYTNTMVPNRAFGRLNTIGLYLAIEAVKIMLSSNGLPKYALPAIHQFLTQASRRCDRQD